MQIGQYPEQHVSPRFYLPRPMLVVSTSGVFAQQSLLLMANWISIERHCSVCGRRRRQTCHPRRRRGTEI